VELKNCKQCGKLYLYTGNSLCRDCLEELEKSFLKVRDYISQNPEADIETVSKATGVEPKQILQMLRDGRLQYKGAIVLKCKSCGAPIESGYLCLDCQREMSNYVRKSSGLDNSQHLNRERNVYHTQRRLNRSE